MASDLSVTYSDLQKYLARFAGWASDSSSWDTDQTSDAALIIAKGLRKFYFPPGQQGQPRYEWEFLKPVATQVLAAGDYAYDLPDDFSGVIVDDSVAYAAGTTRSRLLQVHESHLTALQGKVSANSGHPAYYCVRPKTHTYTAVQAWEMLVYPTPLADSGTIRYRYVVEPYALSVARTHPLGGAAHSETIIEAVLSAAESYLDDDPNGVHQARFAELLFGSIRLDQEAKGNAS